MAHGVAASAHHHALFAAQDNFDFMSARQADHGSGVIPVDLTDTFTADLVAGDAAGALAAPSLTTLVSKYVSGDPSVANSAEYNIEITFKGTWTVPLQNAFVSAAEAISDFIVGDIPSRYYYGRTIDDLSITAELVPIDGRYGILGSAGPTALRSGSYLPLTGSMRFDSADASYYSSVGLFDDIVLHEMLHTVGLGTIWKYKGLLSGAGTSAPHFTGSLANAAYPATSLIPVENGGGSGTRDAHWEESVFANELMTGYINSNNDLSYMSVASLGDLGYAIVSGANYAPPTFI
jgi:hypothetical protein